MTSPNRVLSANQGLVLKGLIDDISVPTVQDRLDSASETAALSAHQGMLLNSRISAARGNVYLATVDPSDDKVIVIGNFLDNTARPDAPIPNSVIIFNVPDTFDTRSGSTDNISIKWGDTSYNVVSTIGSLSAITPAEIDRLKIFNRADTIALAYRPSHNNNNNSFTFIANLSKTRVLDSLDTSNPIAALSARQGVILNNKFNNYVAKTEVIDSFTSRSTRVPLAANRGRLLKDAIDDIPTNRIPTLPGTNDNNKFWGTDANRREGWYPVPTSEDMVTPLVDGLDSDRTDAALTAHQGMILDGKITRITGNAFKARLEPNIADRNSIEILDYVNGDTRPTSPILNKIFTIKVPPRLATGRVFLDIKWGDVKGRLLVDLEVRSTLILSSDSPFASGDTISLVYDDSFPNAPFRFVANLTRRDVTSSLTSSSVEDVLNANAGRLLKQEIDNIPVDRIPTSSPGNNKLWGTDANW